MEDLFIKASRTKLRFDSKKGLLNTEDLWDVPLTVLDGIAVDLHKSLQEASHGSFLGRGNSAKTKLDLMFAVAKYIIETRLAEIDAKEQAKVNAEKRSRIAKLIEEKEDESLKSLSLEDLKKLAAEV